VRTGSLLTLAPPVLVAFPAIGWVASAARRAGWASLGRDQGIFQYVAWAVGQGDVAYRDVRDVNGPVITMVHGLFQRLGGTDEHRFRVLDILFTAISFAIAGALIPTKKVGPSVRVAWSVAAVVALLAQYLVYGFWDTAQRESFLDWFVLVSIALAALPPARSRTLFFAGLLSFIPWLGKPTFALFTASQLVALLIEREPLKVRVHRVGVFVLGGALGLALPLVWIALRGDLAAWARITFVDVPAMYRFIWPRPASAILSLPGYSTLAQMALATTAGLLFLIVLGRLSRRALPIALMPALGLVSVIVQAKGFPYHFHPVTLGISYGWLVALAVTWEAVSTDASLVRRGAVALAALLVGARASFLAWNAPYPPVPEAQDKASLESPERLSEFDRIDFFPRALRDGAEYVAAKTSPSDRIQMYAMDAYFLFLAGRKSATPYIHAYDLNVDAALHGSFDPGGARPSPVETARIRALHDAHERDLVERLERSPPAAFVFIDRSPLMSWQDSVMDFSEHCTDAARFLNLHYRQTADFDGIRIWLRNDLPD
jgi:hypothetical protein